MPRHGTLPILLFLAAIFAGPASVRGQTTASSPCLADDRYGVMDFWVGYWDVVMPNGQQAGTNRIQKVLAARGLRSVEAAVVKKTIEDDQRRSKTFLGS